MNNLVLYRKYRPQKFSEVVGQEHITDTIQKAISLENIAHAYLFSGTRGTGKTTVARLLAQEIKCSVNDLNEIDAASNRGIDDIRELREAVTVLPFESPYKVYIIDEVHMLTKEAFNALLKTLEEPPKHVVFVLATTEIEKIPDTILSRCQTFTFKKPPLEILKKTVLDICKKEKLKLEDGAEDLIALLGEGSFRDTLGILQKVISTSGDSKISIQEVEKITGAPQGSLVNDFISAISEKNLDKGLRAIQKALENSTDIQMFVKLIMHKIRAILLTRFAKDMLKTIQDDFSEKDFEFIKKLAEDKNSNLNSQTLIDLIESSSQIKLSYISQLPLELLLIKLIKDVK
ncbi:MAG: DNA polymerase III subunit gamma/tau [Candidatus Pacebacteria bacterium]|nr:DNA polymerase III subunit gamma/tau [Candidatus Paceibacterota bacterium]